MLRIHSDWLLTPQRVAIHEPTGMGVIADVHLGYHEARRQAGDAIPLLDLATLLRPLEVAASRGKFHRLVIAGDLWEKGWNTKLVDEFLLWLLGAGIELAGVVPGNHDRGLPPEGANIPFFPQGMNLGNFRVIHGDGDWPPSEPFVCGHFHPSLRRHGRKFPCYLVGPGGLVLPAFSADAAGVHVGGVARWQTYHAALIMGDKVMDMGPVDRLRPGFTEPRPSGSGAESLVTTNPAS